MQALGTHPFRPNTPTHIFFFKKKKKKHISQHYVVGESHPSTLSDKVLIELISHRSLSPRVMCSQGKLNKALKWKRYRSRSPSKIGVVINLCHKQRQTYLYLSTFLDFQTVFKSCANFVGLNSLLISNGNCSHWKTQLLIPILIANMNSQTTYYYLFYTIWEQSG